MGMLRQYPLEALRTRDGIAVISTATTDHLLAGSASTPACGRSAMIARTLRDELPIVQYRRRWSRLGGRAD
jgi:hypothetical protein